MQRSFFLLLQDLQLLVTMFAAISKPGCFYGCRVGALLLGRQRLGVTACHDEVVVCENLNLCERKRAAELEDAARATS
eukprot:m.163257 g.163257  ORF g.163257 m.163257 type:complete len:78 (+) comp10307_c0_seq9:4664-4897(+)